ncbi:MAG: hypothetical protein RLZZ436_380 [Planctomycetota bacterium]
MLEIEPNHVHGPVALGVALIRSQSALPVLQTALEMGSQDLQTPLGMRQSLEALNRANDADDYYQRIIRLGTPEPVVELAKERSSAVATRRMRSAQWR